MIRIPMTLTLAVVAMACGSAPGGDHAHGAGGHAHGGDDHPHGSEAEAHEEGEDVTLAKTRWTATHELFVEFDAPVAGRAFAYHAHVTRLADNHAATSGTLTLRFERAGATVVSHADAAVARPGIFSAEARAPAEPGAYEVLFTYVDGDEQASWPVGRVDVGVSAGVASEDEDEGEITFLKESQWQIPFHVAPAAERPVAPVVSASGVVHPAPENTAVVAAPADGLLVWSDTLPAIGRRVTKGDRLALLLPVGATEHWSSLQADVSTARIDRDLATAELRRIESLLGGDLVSARRLDEAQAALARASARVSATKLRLSALTSGDAGAVPVRAPATGLLVGVGARHGEVVGAGVALVTVASGEAVWLEARVFEREASELSPIGSLTAFTAGSGPIDLSAIGGKVLTDRLVYDPRTLSAPLAVSVPSGSGLQAGDLVDVEVGVGTPTPRLAVPRTAVIEINGQDLVFVQQTGESFTRRRVVLGDRDATHVVIEGGLARDEQVVTVGGFDLHVASLSGALESHKH